MSTHRSLCMYVCMNPCELKFPILFEVYLAKQVHKSQLSACFSDIYGHRQRTRTSFFSLIASSVMSGLTLRHVFFVHLRSFIAETEQLKEQWVDAMRNAIGEALSNSEVAERIWAEPSNSLCADCGAPKPEWAAINLCVVVCNRCAGLCEGGWVQNTWPNTVFVCISFSSLKRMGRTSQ